MRLIDTWTGQFKDFFDLEQTPPYAILSHTWDKKGEQTYQELVKIQQKYKHALHNSRSDNSRHGADVQVLVPSESEARATFEPHPTLFVSSGHPNSEPEPPNNYVQTQPVNPSVLCLIWNDPGLSDKVRKACEIARRDGYRYIWIDSSCIDKTSSSELSEAINSMFNWYSAAQVCYAFLADVPSNEDVRPPTTVDIDPRFIEFHNYGFVTSLLRDSSPSRPLYPPPSRLIYGSPSPSPPPPARSAFQNSRSFRRGWTLQELVAPQVVVFLSKDWKGLGTRHGLADLIQDITTIDRRVLTHEKAVGDESVANRMRWASNRETTRVEDKAYSLLGIFGINMPTLYGEGIYAFRRLQEEILQRIPDQSLFVWRHEDDTGPVQIFPAELSIELSMDYMIVESTDYQTPFASSPDRFGMHDSRIVQPMEDAIKFLNLPVEEYTRTPHGIRTQLYLLPLKILNPDFRVYILDSVNTVEWYLVVLRSQHVGHPQELLSRLCYLRSSDKADVEFLYYLPKNVSVNFPLSKPKLPSSARDTFFLSLDTLKEPRHSEMGKIKTVYLPHPKPHAPQRQLQAISRIDYTTLITLTMPTWAREAALGDRVGGYYSVSNYVEGPAGHLSFTLINAISFNIHIHCRHMVTRNRENDAFVMIDVRVWILSDGTNNEALQDNTPIHLLPPYTSAIWTDCRPWKMALPTRRLNLEVDPASLGKPVTLVLGLDLTAPFQYNLRVDVTPYANNIALYALQLHPYLFSEFPLNLKDPRKTLNFILSGSTRRALKMKGYSVDLAFHPSLNLGDPYSHTLTLSPSVGEEEFVIVVEYLHAIGDHNHDCYDTRNSLQWAGVMHYQPFEIVARVTLESSSSIDGLEREVQDGPYVVAWEDQLGGNRWSWSLNEMHVALTTPAGNSLTLHLGFDFAWYSEYYLNIHIDPGIPKFQPSELWNHRQPQTLGCWAQMHMGVAFKLTLPEHYKRALQAQGYNVRLERLDIPGGESESGNSESVHHVLTLSYIQAGVDIVVEYSHRLTTGYSKPLDPTKANLSIWNFSTLGPSPLPETSAPQPDSTLPAPAKASLKQEMTLLATIWTRCRSDSGGGTGVAALAQGNDAPITTDWNARSDIGWHRHLPKKDLVLTMPTGCQVVLRLGFYLVWYNEYCLMVEINPRTPVSCPQASPSDIYWVPLEFGPLRLADYEFRPLAQHHEFSPLAVETSPGPSGSTAAETHDEPETRTVGDWEGKDPDPGSHSDGRVEVDPVAPSTSRDDEPPAPHHEPDQDSMEQSGREQSAAEAQDTPLRQSSAECHTESKLPAESHHSTPPETENPATLASSPARQGRWKLLKKKLRCRVASMFRFGC